MNLLNLQTTTNWKSIAEEGKKIEDAGLDLKGALSSPLPEEEDEEEHDEETPSDDEFDPFGYKFEDDDSEEELTFVTKYDTTHIPDHPNNLLHKSVLNKDISDHLDEFENVTFHPPELLNFNHPWRKTVKFPDEQLDQFIPNSSPEKYRFDHQV